MVLLKDALYDLDRPFCDRVGLDVHDVQFQLCEYDNVTFATDDARAAGGLRFREPDEEWHLARTRAAGRRGGRRRRRRLRPRRGARGACLGLTPRGSAPFLALLPRGDVAASSGAAALAGALANAGAVVALAAAFTYAFAALYRAWRPRAMHALTLLAFAAPLARLVLWCARARSTGRPRRGRGAGRRRLRVGRRLRARRAPRGARRARPRPAAQAPEHGAPEALAHPALAVARAGAAGPSSASTSGASGRRSARSSHAAPRGDDDGRPGTRSSIATDAPRRSSGTSSRGRRRRPGGRARRRPRGGPRGRASRGRRRGGAADPRRPQAVQAPCGPFRLVLDRRQERIWMSEPHGFPPGLIYETPSGFNLGARPRGAPARPGRRARRSDERPPARRRAALGDARGRRHGRLPLLRRRRRPRRDARRRAAAATAAGVLLGNVANVVWSHRSGGGSVPALPMAIAAGLAAYVAAVGARPLLAGLGGAALV
ncbi:hypothetical protein SO694_00081021 [Aureococcus anophagefferens]|uniref:Uncharacterized protein n=1 Tax=Aureococcus anophagefferens TaxID=44056 RepID=A0ABR1G526_AURAN